MKQTFRSLHIATKLYVYYYILDCVLWAESVSKETNFRLFLYFRFSPFFLPHFKNLYFP